MGLSEREGKEERRGKRGKGCDRRRRKKTFLPLIFLDFYLFLNFSLLSSPFLSFPLFLFSSSLL